MVLIALYENQQGSGDGFNLGAKQNRPHLVVPFLIIDEHQPSSLLRPPVELITDCLLSRLDPRQVDLLLPHFILQPVAHITPRPIINLQQVLSLYQRSDGFLGLAHLSALHEGFALVFSDGGLLLQSLVLDEEASLLAVVQERREVVFDGLVIYAEHFFKDVYHSVLEVEALAKEMAQEALPFFLYLEQGVLVLLKVFLGLGDVCPQGFDPLLVCGNLGRMVVLRDFLRLSLLGPHLVVNVFLGDPLALDVLEQPNNLLIFCLESALQQGEFSPMEGDLLEDFLLDGHQLFLAVVDALLFYLFLDGLHPANKIFPELVLDLDGLGVAEQRSGRFEEQVLFVVVLLREAFFQLAEEMLLFGQLGLGSFGLRGSTVTGTCTLLMRFLLEVRKGLKDMLESIALINFINSQEFHASACSFGNIRFAQAKIRCLKACWD